VAGDLRLVARLRVGALACGHVECMGPFYRGARMGHELSACLSVEDVRVVLTCKNTQLADQAPYRFVGIEPTAQAIQVNKRSVHFRADFVPIGQQILVAAPGPLFADLSQFAWTRLTRGLRLKPNAPVS